jgi:GT2 family glycosyltransferase
MSGPVDDAARPTAPDTADDADLAVVVLSYGPRDTLVRAVASLRAQDTPADIVVVHSGGGQLPPAVTGLPGVRIVMVADRLFVGAARNLGIASTRAPFVAFLADDCEAAQGWVRRRLAHHRAGTRAVASALVSHRPGSIVAMAAHMSLYCRRMPRADPAIALRYGVSYARDLLVEHGPFREDLESGEDTDFNRRFAAEGPPLWTSDVVTVHHGAETLSDFLESQWRRGGRMAAAGQALGIYNASVVSRNAIFRTRNIVAEMFAVIGPVQWLAALLATPLIVLGNIVYAWSAYRTGRRA